MNLRTLLTPLLLLFATGLLAQSESAQILETIVRHYYKNEKIIVKGRQQLLFFYCEKPNNNEEIFETVQGMKLAPATVAQIRNAVKTDVSPENWNAELEWIFANRPAYLSQKINDCQSVEQYQQQRAKLNLNNQRLMIVSKPILFEKGQKALVKVTFYRSIEHNNGSVLLMEKSAEGWTIKDFLNSWST